MELGGKLDVDSDQSKDSIAGVSYMNELILVQSMGFTPLQVIGMATKNLADWLGKLKDLGTIEEGKLGDLIVVTKDPLENIRNIRDNVETVIIGGEEMDIRFHPDYRNPIPSGFLEEQYYNAVPELDARLEPRIAVEGTENTKVTVKGEGFLKASQAFFKEVPVSTRFVRPDTLEVALPGALLREVGSWPITVVNPAPGGGRSNKVYFMIKFRP